MSKCKKIDLRTGIAVVRSDGVLAQCSTKQKSKPFYKAVHYFFNKEKIRAKINLHKVRQMSLMYVVFGPCYIIIKIRILLTISA